MKSIVLFSRNRLIAVALVAVALLAGLIYLSLTSVRDSLSEPVLPVSPTSGGDQVKSQPRPTAIPAFTPPVMEPVAEARTASSNSEAPGGLPSETDVQPPLGSEAPVPAVFGLLADSNVTNLPFADGLEGIAEEFAEKVKQGGWDTTSEAYRRNWEKAAAEADDILRARYGTEIYLKLKQNAAP